MLYDLGGKEVKTPVHEAEYRAFRRRLSDREFNGVVEALNRFFDHHDRVTSSYIPGKDWTGTVYQPLFEACGKTKEAAALFFGQIVWRVVMARPDAWHFYRSDAGDREVIGMTYFRKTER